MNIKLVNLVDDETEQINKGNACMYSLANDKWRLTS